jgi:hypothetical protein
MYFKNELIAVKIMLRTTMVIVFLFMFALSGIFQPTIFGTFFL